MFDHLIEIPAKVRFGVGSIAQLGKVASEYGKRAFLVYDPYLNDSDIIKHVILDLERNGILNTSFANISPNPRNTVIDEAAAKCVSNNCDVVIGIGGGSAIDSAKAIAIVAKNGYKSWDYTRRFGEECVLPEKGKLPLIVVPTTSGTGTEATPFSVINNPGLHFKATIVDIECYPTIALVDPALTISMPPFITALTGIDAFAHAFEAYISRVDNPFVDAIALEAIRLFVENIEECVNYGDNIGARSNMMICSTLSGIAIGHCCTTMPHAIAQALGGITDAPHGGAIATCINQVIEWTLPLCEEKFAKVAEIFDASISELPNIDKAKKLPEYIDKLFMSIMDGKLVNMRTYGLKDDQVDNLVDVVLKFYYGDCELHPKVPSKEDIRGVVMNCL